MNRSSLTLWFLVIALAAGADIPMLRLDGSWGKSPIHPDPYPYTKMDFAQARSNPLGIKVVKKVSSGGEGYEALRKLLEGYDRKGIRETLAARYTRKVEQEFDLTDKEKQVAADNPGRFPREAKTGKRLMVSNVLQVGGKDYPFQGTSFVGMGDLNGDGVQEMVLVYFPPVTYRVYPTLRIFDEKGGFLWDRHFEGTDFAACALADLDGDQADELVLLIYGSNEIQVLGCGAAGEPLPADSSMEFTLPAPDPPAPGTGQPPPPPDPHGVPANVPPGSEDFSLPEDG